MFYLAGLNAAPRGALLEGLGPALQAEAARFCNRYPNIDFALEAASVPLRGVNGLGKHEVWVGAIRWPSSFPPIHTSACGIVFINISGIYFVCQAVSGPFPYFLNSARPPLGTLERPSRRTAWHRDAGGNEPRRGAGQQRRVEWADRDGAAMRTVRACGWAAWGECVCRIARGPIIECILALLERVVGGR